ncbi:MAG: NfeD family protein [Phycisphaerae bacterium]
MVCRSKARGLRLSVAVGLLAVGLLAGGAAPIRNGHVPRPASSGRALTHAANTAGQDPPWHTRASAAPAEETSEPPDDTTAPPDKAADDAEPDAPLPTARVPVSGIIDTALRTSVARRGGDAVDDGRGLVIFHITSSGGYLEDGLELSREIQRLGRRARTLAFVDAKAYSAAAILAFSCQEIVMTPEASIGACTPYMASPVGGAQPMEEQVRAKIEGTIVERLETLAEKHGYPKALLKAMVTMPTVVIEARNEKTGEVQYVEEEDLFALGPDWKKGKTVVSGSEVLTVGAEDARTYGLAKHVVPRLGRLYDLYPIKDRIEVYPVTWNETLVSWLNNMYFKALLVLIGLLGIYVEMHTPGVGVPGAIGLAAFGLLFATSFLAGRPEWLPVLLFVGGMALLAVELLVTPGFGVLGGGGAVLVLASIILALPPSYMEPGMEGGVDWDALARSVAVTTVVVVVFVISAMVLARYLPQMPLLKRLVLSDTSVSDGSSRAAAASQERSTRVGETGRTTTMLRPAGKARIGERLVDVVTDGEFLDAETPVRVVQVRGNRIVVAPAPEETHESETTSA